MIGQLSIPSLNIGELLGEAIRREKESMGFYEHLLTTLGPDAHTLIAHFLAQQSERIVQLERLKDEIEELRELTGAIAD
jgi:hypothetical protein